MNSNLNRALAAALVALGGVGSALAQFDSDYRCIDPTNTKPYSDVFIYLPRRNDLFGATIGVTGTVAYTPACDGGGPIAGRIGFTIGRRVDPNTGVVTGGSIQDDIQSFVDPVTGTELHDQDLRLTLGTNFGDTTGIDYGLAYGGSLITPASGGNSFARVYVTTTTAAGVATNNNYLYGLTGFSLFFVGRSGRYSYTQGTVTGDAGNGVDARLYIDVIGDAAKLSWRLTNNLTTTDTVSLGLGFGQVVRLLERSTGPSTVPFGEFRTVYTTIPGRRPLTVDERFYNASDPVPAGGGTPGVPAFVDFSVSQAFGFGLQVVNNPSALAPFDQQAAQQGLIDQTPVDRFTIGKAPSVIDGTYSATDPQQTDFVYNAPGNGNADAAALSRDPAYLQIWSPRPVGTSGAAGANQRDIISYYRSTNGDSSYASTFTSYSAVVDTPKAITTNPATITTDQPFATAPFTIRVNVDNTGGFSNVDTTVVMQSVQVVLNLPAGITDGSTGSRTISRTISRIGPAEIGFVDFTNLVVDPNVFGAQRYTVTITPQPGFQTKTISGTINVAAAPRLLIRQNANLVSPGFQFADSSWESVLGLTLNDQFQAYTWDALRQKYVTQTAAERGRGTWILSTDDLGYIPLGGSPSQPDDQFPDPTNNDVAQNGSTSSTVRLRTGWNLVGNPYNYAFPLGQLVGIPIGGNQSLSFADLVSNGYTNGAFAYFDQGNQQYQFITGNAASLLQPNYGYWIYANFPFDLQFPPLYELFIRSANPVATPQRFNDWKLQLKAASAGNVDAENYIGVTSNAEEAMKQSVRKAPMQPSTSRANVLYSYISGGGGAMAQSVRNVSGTQSYSYSVYSKKGGPVTISWPNLRAIPSNLDVKVKDNATRKTVNARQTSGYTFAAKAASIRSFTVTVTPKATRIQVTSASSSLFRSGRVVQARIAFRTTGRGTGTIGVYKGSRYLGNAVAQFDVENGTNTVVWPLTDGKGEALPNGAYTLYIRLVGESGEVTSRSLTTIVRR